MLFPCVTFCLTTKSNQKRQEILILPRAVPRRPGNPDNCRGFLLSTGVSWWNLYKEGGSGASGQKPLRSEILVAMGKVLDPSSYYQESRCTAAHGKEVD
jgi:hypothetical protein